jgi:hypothetical protein
MQQGKYIFAPLKEPGKAEAGRRAEDWREEQYLSNRMLLESLKLYGKAAGIPAEKLNSLTLRRTAMRLRLEEGGSVEEMQVFLESQEEPRYTKRRLRKLPQLPEGTVESMAVETEAEPPNRQAKPFQAGDGLIHGLYALSQPSGAVKAILALDIQGMDEELEMLQTLADGLMERFERDPSAQDVIHLVDAYSQACVKMAWLEKVMRELGKEKGNPGSRNYRGRSDMTPLEIELRQEFEAMQREKRASKRGPEEAIAGMRVMLRRLYQTALENQDNAHYIFLVTTYGRVCQRLLKLLWLGGDEEGQFEEYLQEVLNEAIEELRAEGFFR